MKILELLTPKRLTGNLGERAAARFLRRNKYKILARNFVGDGREIDIVARKKDVIAFVEVKTRTIGHENPKEPRPSSSVDPKKQQGIIEAARVYLSLHRMTGRKRFDIIEVYLEKKGKRKKVSIIKHLENTFNMNTAYQPYR